MISRWLLIILASIGLTAALVVSSLAAASAASRHPRMTAPVVITSYGRLRGRSVGEAQDFLGVPFARPPVGRLRLRPPVGPAHWTGIRNATKRAPACIQFAQGTLKPGQPISENCLYLDIYRPARVSSKHKLPVMFWIHGGGDLFGSSEEYDTRRWIRSRP